MTRDDHEEGGWDVRGTRGSWRMTAVGHADAAETCVRKGGFTRGEGCIAEERFRGGRPRPSTNY